VTNKITELHQFINFTSDYTGSGATYKVVIYFHEFAQKISLAIQNEVTSSVYICKWTLGADEMTMMMMMMNMKQINLLLLLFLLLLLLLLSIYKWHQKQKSLCAATIIFGWSYGGGLA